MFVQDIKSPGVNITAELTEEEVDCFRQVCKMFIPFRLHEKNINEYLSKLPQAPSTKRTNSLATNDELPKKNAPTECGQSSVHGMKKSPDGIGGLDQNCNVIPKIEAATAKIESPTSIGNSQKADNLLDINKIAVHIKTTAIDLIFRTMGRISNEMDIVGLLIRHLKAFDSKLEAMSFGSATYGFGGRNTDFNILVNTSIVYD